MSHIINSMSSCLQRFCHKLPLAGTKLLVNTSNIRFTLLCVVKNKMSFSVSVSETPENITRLSDAAKCLAPSLTSATQYKGQAGKIGVFGGSLEYTGAPYFAAISALKVGADIAHVFCSPDAAVPIKCYSPELIVHPLLQPGKLNDIKVWIDRMNVLIIGPGLGRDNVIFELIKEVIAYIKESKKPLVIDADGLFLVTQNPQVLEDFNSVVVLTPNAMELSRLMGMKSVTALAQNDTVNFLKHSKWNEFVYILSKGAQDEIITAQKKIDVNENIGSGRRCGGQGDILSGALAVFLHWSNGNVEAGMYAASKLVRECNASAFKRKGRSMTATDMIEDIHEVFQKEFEVA